MDEGHPVTHGQGVQSNGLDMQLEVVSPEESLEAKQAFNLSLPDGVQLLEIKPMFPSETILLEE